MEAPKARRLLVLVAVVGAASACKSKPAPEGSGGASSPASSTTVASAAASVVGSASAGTRDPRAVPGATAALLPNMSIPERFSVEAAARPAGIKPNVEDVWAALEKAGLTVVEKKQHLGQVFGARYCVGGKAMSGAAKLLDISVCEFASEELAKMSRDHSTEALKIIPNRTLYANKQTLLIVREEQKAPENDDALAKAVDAYTKL